MANMVLTNQTLPQGQPNSLTEIKKMLTDITDEVAVSEALTSYMTPDTRLVRAAQTAGSFQVGTIDTSGLGNYSKFKGSPLGAVGTTFEEYKCRYDRARSFVLDGVDVMQNDGLLDASAVVAEFIRSEVVPEIDATRIATCASTAITATNTVEKAPAKASFFSDILTGINKVRSNLHLRTTQGFKVHISDKYQDMLEQSSEFSRTKDISTGLRRLDTGVDMINLAEVIYTPEDYMYSAFDYASAISQVEPDSSTAVPAGGFSPSSTAKEVAALIVAPNVANGLIASEAQQIFPMGTVPGIFGSQIDYRLYHDCLILKNKRPGVYAITVPSARTVTETTAKTTASTKTSK